MPWITVSPASPLSAARRKAISATSSDKISLFLSAVASHSDHRRPPPGPPPGAIPLRSHPAAYTALMKSYARSGRPDEALRLFRHLQCSRPIAAAPNVLHYNTLLNAFLTAHRPADARRLLDEMLAAGLAPSTATYTILIKSQSLNPNQIDFAYEIIKNMVRSGCSPDAITYSALISVLCRSRRLEEAWGILDQMLEEKLSPTVNAYTCIVRGYCLEGRIKEAKRFVAAMESVGCQPDTVTYSILIEGLCERGQFYEIERILKESEVKHWKPNEITYNIYMSGLCRVGRVDEAFRQLDAMKKSGLRPTMETLNILFDCLCRDSKVWEAKGLLEGSDELGWDVDVFIYNTLMSRFCDIGCWVTVLKLLTDMLKKGISPDTCTFTIVIRSLCMAGKLQKAKCIINSRGFVADVVAFNTLMHWFYMAGIVNEVRLLFAAMEAEEIPPNKFTYCIMIDALCSEGNCLEAIGYFFRSFKHGFLPDLVVRLIYWLVKGGNLRELLYMFEGTLRQGLVLDGFMFSSLIKACCREGLCQSIQFYKVGLILDKMLGIR